MLLTLIFAADHENYPTMRVPVQGFLMLQPAYPSHSQQRPYTPRHLVPPAPHDAGYDDEDGYHERPHPQSVQDFHNWLQHGEQILDQLPHIPILSKKLEELRKWAERLDRLATHYPPHRGTHRMPFRQLQMK